MRHIINAQSPKIKLWRVNTWKTIHGEFEDLRERRKNFIFCCWIHTWEEVSYQRRDLLAFIECGVVVVGLLFFTQEVTTTTTTAEATATATFEGSLKYFRPSEEEYSRSSIEWMPLLLQKNRK